MDIVYYPAFNCAKVTDKCVPEGFSIEMDNGNWGYWRIYPWIEVTGFASPEAALEALNTAMPFYLKRIERFKEHKRKMDIQRRNEQIIREIRPPKK